MGRSFHCVLGGKGGAGKSVSASFLLQAGQACGKTVEAIECDQANRTLSRYDALEVEEVQMLDQFKRLRPTVFDEVVETLQQTNADLFVMDNGQASFAPFLAYLPGDEALEELEESGREVFLHVLITGITGGQLGPSTVVAAKDVLDALGDRTKVVLWENDHFGRTGRLALRCRIASCCRKARFSRASSRCDLVKLIARSRVGRTPRKSSGAASLPRSADTPTIARSTRS